MDCPRAYVYMEPREEEQEEQEAEEGPTFLKIMVSLRWCVCLLCLYVSVSVRLSLCPSVSVCLSVCPLTDLRVCCVGWLAAERTHCDAVCTAHGC